MDRTLPPDIEGGFAETEMSEVPRVLIAASRDWVGTARLPSVLSAGGLEVDLLDLGNSAASASSRVSRRMVEPGGAARIAERVCEISGEYDRVIACDEPLLHALLALDDSRAGGVLSTPRCSLETLLDKTRFSAAAERAGFHVPEWRVAATLGEVAEAAQALGPDVVVKARRGYAGLSVRFASGASAAVSAAKRVGVPALVERRVPGEIGLVPCLYDRGRLVGVMAAHKARTLGATGPSAVARPWRIDDGLRSIAEKAGEVFAIDGFASLDVIRETGTGLTRVIEINPRPVPALYVGARIGVDFGALYASVLAGGFDAVPRLGRGAGPLPLFPQELQRLRRTQGRLAGTTRWAVTPGAVRELPWDDPGLMRHYLRRAR